MKPPRRDRDPEIERLRRDLELASEQLRHLLALSTEMLCVAGYDGYLKSVSAGWSAVLGHPVTELLERSLIEFVHAEDRADTVAAIARLREQGGTVTFDNRWRAADGSYRQIHWSTGASSDPQVYYAVGHSAAGPGSGDGPIVFHDPLTELPNRSLLVDRLERLMGRARHGGPKVALLHLDLETYRSVNATLGPLAADQLLVGVARRLEHAVRPGDLVARLGSDEFAVVLVHIPGRTVAVQVAARLMEEIAGPYSVSGREFRRGVSAGLALADDAQARAVDLLRDAETALERARSEGRGRCVVHEAEPA